MLDLLAGIQRKLGLLPEARSLAEKAVATIHDLAALYPDDKTGKLTEVGVRPGDTVYYGKYSGTDVEVDGQKFVILREADILGVLE